VREQVERSKKVLVLPSTAFWGIPPSATLDCIGAFPAATFSTQNGIPWGDQVPFVPHTRRAGPSSSKPLHDKDGEGIAGQMIRLVAHLSQLYSAIVPSRASSSNGLNVTVLCAGAPGKPHPDPEAGIQKGL